jgi:CheY-like chemotaxis protein
VTEKTVLVVDDEEDIRDSLQEAFSDEGFGVVAASNGRQALEMLGAMKRQPCAVVLDIAMPVMNGLELHAAMRANPALARIPVIVSTSDPSRAPSGVVVMKKPINLAHLLRTVADLCS